MARPLPVAGPGSARVRLAAVAVSAAVVGSTMLPYLYLDSHAPPGFHYTWLDTNLPDQASYLMWMQQHARGALLVHDRMTTDPHPPILPNPVWLILGSVQRLTGAGAAAVYHAGRLFFSLAYLWVLFLLCMDYFSGRARPALIAFGVAAVGGGFGWLAAAGFPVASADWVTELWSYPSMLHYPHFAASLLLLCTTLLLWRQARRRGSRGRAAWAGVSLALLAFVHPYTAGTIFLAMVLYASFSFLCRRNTPGDVSALWAWVLLPAAAGLAAVGSQVLWNPVVAAWAAQNRMPSPPPWQYLAGLGWAGIAAAAGIITTAARRRIDRDTAFLLVWLGTAALLAYGSPLVPYERRCIEGVHIAVVLLAVQWVAPRLERLTPKAFAAAAALALLAVAPSSFTAASSECRPDNPAYVPADWPALFARVRASTGDDGVFADARTGLFLAAFSGARVFVGHHEMTPDFEPRMREVARVFDPSMSPAERARRVERAGCRWMVVDAETAKAMGDGGGTSLALRESSKTWALYGPR